MSKWTQKCRHAVFTTASLVRVLNIFLKRNIELFKGKKGASKEQSSIQSCSLIPTPIYIPYAEDSHKRTKFRHQSKGQIGSRKLIWHEIPKKLTIVTIIMNHLCTNSHLSNLPSKDKTCTNKMSTNQEICDCNPRIFAPKVDSDSSNFWLYCAENKKKAY